VPRSAVRDVPRAPVAATSRGTEVGGTPGGGVGIVCGAPTRTSTMPVQAWPVLTWRDHRGGGPSPGLRSVGPRGSAVNTDGSRSPPAAPTLHSHPGHEISHSPISRRPSAAATSGMEQTVSTGVPSGERMIVKPYRKDDDESRTLRV
jgi:hypothetical protein